MKEPETLSDEFLLLEWANVLLGHRGLIIALTVLSGAVAFGLCRSASPLFTAETTVMPNREAETRSLEKLFGIDLGGRSSEILDVFSASYVSSYYMELLRSDALLKPLAMKAWENGQTLGAMLKLKEKPTESIERQTLGALRKSLVRVRQDRATGMLTIQCSAPDATVAADMANTLTAALKTFLAIQKTSGTSQLVRLAESRTSEGQIALRQAEQALQNFRDKNRGIENNPQLQMKEKQLQNMVDLQKEIFIKTRSQVEVLRLGEQQPADLILIIQPAEVPLRKSWPPTRNAVAGASLFGLFLATGIAFLRNSIRKMANRGVPEFAEFAGHLRALNWFLPGIVLLLPKGYRRRPRPAAAVLPSSEGASQERYDP